MRPVIVMAINDSSVFRWHRHVSPHQVLWHAISGNCVGSDATSDHRALIALADASCSFRWHELIASVPANDRNLATTEPFTHRAIGGDAPYLIAIDKIVSFISLSSRQAVLFDQLLDLRVARFFVRLFLLSAAQLLIASGFGELRLLRSEFRVGRHGALVLRQLLPLPLLLPQLLFGLLGLPLIGQARLQQLIAQ